MFQPENTLEDSLIKAAKEPAYRPQFIKDFIESNIFIIQDKKESYDEGEIILGNGTNLQIQNIEIEGIMHIPIFSSVLRIQEVADDEVGYLAMNALEFLKIVNGTDIALNPGSECGKRFSSTEVDSIVDGSIWEKAQCRVVEKETTVLIGQPTNYPHELVNSLRKYFKTKKEIFSAYLAHVHTPDSNDPPHTLIGIVATENWDDIMSSIGIIIEDISIPDPPIDFIEIDTDGGNIDYFENIEPFYT